MQKLVFTKNLETLDLKRILSGQLYTKKVDEFVLKAG